MRIVEGPLGVLPGSPPEWELFHMRAKHAAVPFRVAGARADVCLRAKTSYDSSNAETRSAARGTAAATGGVIPAPTSRHPASTLT